LQFNSSEIVSEEFNLLYQETLLPYFTYYSTLLVMSSGSGSTLDAKRPKHLGIYYGWPAGVNGGGAVGVQEAVESFKKYDLLVLAGSLSNASHGNHTFTKKLIAHPEMSKTDIYGYMSTTETPQNAVKRINAWVKMGDITGIFLDEYGYDYANKRTEKHNTRAHHNFLLYYIHNSFQKDTNVPLKVFVNAWNQPDVFAPEPGTGLKHTLNPDDWTLWESYQIKRGKYVTETEWRTKADILAKYAGMSQVAAVTTTFTEAETASGTTIDYDLDQFKYAYVSSIMDGLDAFGWGEDHYASRGGMLWRPRPLPDPITPGGDGSEAEVGNESIVVKVDGAYQKSKGAIVVTQGYFLSINPSTHEVVFRD